MKQKKLKFSGHVNQKRGSRDRDHYSTDDRVIMHRNESQNTCLTYRSFPVESHNEYGLNTGDILNPGLFTAGFIVLCL